jgi:signal peptidase I
MKRALGLILVILACVIEFLSLRGTMPIMAIFGSSMEPALNSGDLMIIKPVLASEVKVGDIIVYNVPPLIRERYSYPLVIAHRVIKVSTEPGTTFRTKGDNASEDPFTVMPSEIRGKVSKQIPYAGLPLLFMQSRQGLVFIVVGLSLLALFLYREELGIVAKKLKRRIFGKGIEESYRNNQALTDKIEAAEKRVGSLQPALEKFATAMGLSAQQLASHTAAIQSLNQASQELNASAAEKNRILMNLMQVVEKPKPSKEETISKIEQAIPKLPKTTPRAEKTRFPPGCVKTKLSTERLATISLSR